MLIALTVPQPQRRAVEQVRRSRWRLLGAAATPYLYLIPALAGVLLWVYRPLIQTVRYSFSSWDLLPTSPQVSVGWHNYDRVIHLPQLWAALRTTGIYALALLFGGVILPLVIGVLTQQVGPRARNLYRAIVFVPVLVSPVVAAAVWSFLLNPNVGLINGTLRTFGIRNVNWLTEGGPARAAIVMIAVWKLLGVSVLVVTAGLAAISTDYYEAAAIDGASRWQIFQQLTLPLLSPTLLFMVITSVLLSSQIVFPLVTALTNGGPAGATTDIYFLLYSYGFSSFDVGLASAAAVLFFLGFGTIAVVLIRLLDRFSFYDH